MRTKNFIHATKYTLRLFFLITALAGNFRAPDAVAQTSVRAWGAGTFVASPPDFNDAGQSIVPATLTNAALVAAGWRHSLALNNNGSITPWGDDSVQQTDFPAGTNYISIACGWQHSVALQAGGIVVASAGDDGFGQVDVPDGLSNVVAIACGFYHSLALKSDGSVAAWGPSTNASSLGVDPDYGQTVVPGNLTNVVAVAGGGWHSLALLADGTVRGWGRADSGQAFIPSGLSNVVAIAAGAVHNLALKWDGTVFAWGGNDYQETNVPVGLSNVVAIAAGGWHSLALKRDGTVVAWGASGPNANSSNVAFGQNIVPAGLTNVIQISGGGYNSLALKGSAPPTTQAALANPVLGTNGFNVSLPTFFGHAYRLEFKQSLSDAVWTALPLKSGNGSTLLFSDTNARAMGQRFYRIRQW